MISMASVATSVLTEGMKAAITEGFGTLTATVSDVILIGIPCIIGIIALTAGVNFALRKVRSLTSWAA